MIIIIIIIISLKYIYLNIAQSVPYNGTCTLTHDCADWRYGRVICDENKKCTCRPAPSGSNGKVFWDRIGHRCVYCPERWIYRETRCYYFDHVAVRKTWSNARQTCQAYTMADLIVFNSVDDLHWFRTPVAASALLYPFGSFSWDNAHYRRFWIGAMNEPFVKYGEFSWIDNRGFRFNQNSSMWCRSDTFGLPSTLEQQPSWNKNNTNETRVALVQWQYLTHNSLPVYCLRDEKPDEFLYFGCERTSATFKTKCDINNMCQNDGICTAVTDIEPAHCDCTETSYGGSYCTGNCGTLPSHCKNDGHCTKLGNCACTPLWTGVLCTEAKDPCLSNPCQHNSKCLQIGNTPNFICDCGDSGWTGELCNITNYPCPAERCMNNGQCKAVGQENFTCNCMKTGYQGTFCEEGCQDTNEPCKNSGSCIDNECFCNPSTKGKFCEIMDNTDSASSLIKNEKTGLKIWLIIALCLVSIVLIIGLIYGRKKVLKSREQRRNSIQSDLSSMNSEIQSKQNADSDSISVISTQASQVTKYIEEYSNLSQK